MRRGIRDNGPGALPMQPAPVTALWVSGRPVQVGSQALSRVFLTPSGGHTAHVVAERLAAPHRVQHREQHPLRQLGRVDGMAL